MKRSCIICLSDDWQPAQNQTLDVVGLGAVSFTIGICRQCGLVAQMDALRPEAMAEHYQAYSNYTILKVENYTPQLTKTVSRFMALLDLAHIGPAGRMYEIGCATGENLYHFRDLGWDVSGCDPSQRAADQGASLFDIRIDVGNEEELLGNLTAVDVFLLPHVLEHLYDPQASLKRIFSALAAEGHLLIEVPCMIAPELLPSGMFSLEHLTYFSERTLSTLLRKAGFRSALMMVTLKSDSYPYPVLTVLAGKNEPSDELSSDFMEMDRIVSAYLRRESELWHNAETRLRSRSEGNAAFIWGGGVHTSQLIARTSILKHYSLHGIVDRDRQKWGTELSGLTVISPEDFWRRRTSETIIISSQSYESAIYADLLKAGVEPENIVTLYQ